MGAVAWAIGQRPVSHPRSSNRTCRFPAFGFPIGFTTRHTASTVEPMSGDDTSRPAFETYRGLSVLRMLSPTLEQTICPSRRNQEDPGNKRHKSLSHRVFAAIFFAVKAPPPSRGASRAKTISLQVPTDRQANATSVRAVACARSSLLSGRYLRHASRTERHCHALRSGLPTHPLSG